MIDFGRKTEPLTTWIVVIAEEVVGLHDIDTVNGQEAYDMKAVDLDADGRLDLILAGRETRNAVWYRNQK